MTKRCKVRGCNAESVTRGVCRAHYNSAHYRIAKGELTDQEAVDAGMLLAKGSLRKKVRKHK